MLAVRRKIAAIVVAASACVSSAEIALAACASFQGTLSINGATGSLQQTLATGDVVTVTVVSNTAIIGMRDFTTFTTVIPSITGATSSATYTVPASLSGHEFQIFGGANPTGLATWSCTPAPVPAAKPSASINNLVTSQLSNQRMQAILGNPLGGDRQFDRLVDQGTGDTTPGTGFTADEKRALDVEVGAVNAPRLGFGNDVRMPLAAQLGRPLDDEDRPGRLGGPAASSRANSGSYNAGGMRFFGSSDGTAHYNFSTSLRDVARAAAQQEQQRLADDPATAALGFRGTRGGALDYRANPLDVWVEGRFVSLNDGRNNADVHGHTGLFGVGVDYVLSRNVLAGVSLQYDSVSQKSSTQSTAAKGTGWLVGPYSTVRLGENLFWQSRLGWGQASNDLSPNLTVTDSVSSSRWMGSSRLVGRYQMGAWQLRPSASVAYMEESFGAYTSGTGAGVSEIKTRLGIATAGPEISYQMRLSPGVLVEPRAGFDTVWTFARDASVAGNSATVAGDVIGPAGVRGRATLGLRTLMVGGTVLDLSGTYDGIGVSDFNNVTGRATVRVPLN